MTNELEILASLAETHRQSQKDFYRTIDMMWNISKTIALIKRSAKLVK